MLRCLLEVLKGQALLWYRNNRTGWENWQEFEDCFRLYYL